MILRLRVICLIGLVGIIINVAPALAQPTAIMPAMEFKGSLDDLDLQKFAPKDHVITGGEEFQKIWKAWRPDDKLPQVDFMKHLALVATTRGSVLNIKASLDDHDLKVSAISTKDLKPGFRYSIVLIPRQAIKTINGKPLPGS